MASEQGPTSSEYIRHHLQHLQKNFAFEDVKQKSIVDFSVFNLDSVFWSALLGAIACFVLWRVARKATPGVPGLIVWIAAGTALMLTLLWRRMLALVYMRALGHVARTSAATWLNADPVPRK